MKKILFILTALMVLSIVSCKKQAVQNVVEPFKRNYGTEFDKSYRPDIGTANKQAKKYHLTVNGKKFIATLLINTPLEDTTHLWQADVSINSTGDSATWRYWQRINFPDSLGILGINMRYGWSYDNLYFQGQYAGGWTPVMWLWGLPTYTDTLKHTIPLNQNGTYEMWFMGTHGDYGREWLIEHGSSHPTVQKL